MMVLSIISIIFSYLFQTIFSNYIGYTYQSLSWLTTLYTVISLLVIRPYFENDKKYLMILGITGFVSGISYTNAALLNTCLFLIAYYFSKFFHFYFPYNYLTINISTLIAIFIYHILSFLFLLAIGYDYYSFKMLLEILLHSVPMTIIYTILSYFVVDSLYHKFSLREVK